MHEEQDILLSFEEFVDACGSQSEWVIALIEENVISVEGSPRLARYTGLQLGRMRRAQRLHRDFDASAQATALILELLDEIEQLRKQLR